MLRKPPSFLKDALDEAHGHLVPETKELLPQEELSNEELDHQQPESPGVFASASEALSRLESICQELGETFFWTQISVPHPRTPLERSPYFQMEAFLQRRFKNFRAMSRWLGTGHVKHGPTHITFVVSLRMFELESLATLGLWGLCARCP